jgi:glycosyltransferase involved in cell wall biosynthesis
MGIDTAQFSISADRRLRARKQLGIDGFTILFLGRLIADKGCDLAIDALPHDVTLLVAGDGPERARLQAQARARAARVRFVGHVRGEARLDVMAAADALIVPSRVDGAPTVALEAMAAGLPIVATRAGGLPELLGDGETALLCDAGAIDLGRAIEKIRSDTQLRRRLSDNSRHESQNHDWRAAGPRLWGRMELATPARDRCIQIFRV